MKAHQYLATSIATLLATMGGQRANALPHGEAVAQGKANFKRDGGRMEIRASDRAVINFRGFNIDRNEAVTFVQPGVKARVLNRVTDGNPTQIFGQLKANGQVMLVNPSGVFFQNGSMVNVGGIIAAAGNISDADFLAGRNRFTELGGEVNNAGTIRATGDVSLVGAHVSNSGIIHSGKGLVSMVAGDEVLVGERGGNVYVSRSVTPGKAAKAGVSNTGKIVAKKALLGVGDFYSLAVQHSGEIRAEEVAVRGGKGGRVEVSGKIDASARGKGKKGGRIEVTGEMVALSGATLDASGDKGGGEVLVGGDWQGKGVVNRAQTTTVDAATVIQADAVKRGVGGKVVVWADGATQFDGQISARGLGAGQAGGQVETSGKLTLGVGGTARVDASSPQGKIGSWLLDPTNLKITAGGTGTIGGADDQEVDASVINTAQAEVTLTATNDITFNQAITMTKAGAGLIATAGRNLVVNPGITITTNNGALNFTADSDKDGAGFLTLGVGSKLTTKGAGVNLTVDHGTAASTDGMTLLGDIDTRASATVFGQTSNFTLAGNNQTGVIEIGAVKLDAGQDRVYARGGVFNLKADEINFTGGTDSVRGAGVLNLIPSGLSTGVKLLSSDDNTAGQLDLTATDLAAISADFFGTGFGLAATNYTGSIVIGDTGGAPLVMDRGGTGNVAFNSGPNGIIANVNVDLKNTSNVTFIGNVVDLKGGLSVDPRSTMVSILQSGNSDIEILDMTQTGQGVVAGKLRLDTAMLKQIGDNSEALFIGNNQTSRTTNLTVIDPLKINSPTTGRLRLFTGGAVIIKAAVDAGAKSFGIFGGGIQFGPGIVGQITSKGGLWIAPSASDVSSLPYGLEVYQGSRLGYDPAQSVLKLHVDDVHTLAGGFNGTMWLGNQANAVSGDTRVNAPLDFRGKAVSGLVLVAPLTVAVDQSITMGTVGGGTVRQSLELRAKEIELSANISGAGDLTIRPVNDGGQAVNPLNRGMLLGAGANDPNRLTLTEAEYNRIGNTFNRIYLGDGVMTGDLEVSGFPVAGSFKLKADTDLIANSTVKLNVPTGGTLATDGSLKRLWVRGLELDITKDVTDLSMLAVNFNDWRTGLSRKFVLNRTTGPVPSGAMDLNSSELGHIKSSVASLNIGWTGQASYGAIEVVNDWVLPTHTELRSLSRTLVDPDVTHYGSIKVAGKIDGNSKNLAFGSDSTLLLEGLAGSITNVAELKIYTPTNGVSIRLLEPGTPTGDPQSLTLSATSYAALGANITNLVVSAGGIGDITVFGAMELVANTRFNSGPGNISLLGALNGTKDLILDSQAITKIEASLGAITPLTSLTVVKRTNDPTLENTVIGSVGRDPITVTTTGNQVWQESIQLLRAATLEAGGTLTIGQSLAAGGNDLALLSNELFLNGAAGGITGSGSLTLGAGTAGTNVAFNAASNTDVANQLDITQAKLSKFTLGGFSNLIIGRNNGTGSVSVKENFGLLQETLIQTGGGAINIEKQLDTSAAVSGAQKLTLSSGAGNITAAGALGSSLALGDLVVNSTGTATFLGAVNAASVWTDAGGSTVLNGGAVTTSGQQTYNDQIVIGKATTLTSSGADDINVNAGGAGNFALNVNTSGVTRLKGTITVGSVETNVGGTVELAANITTTGAQNYHEQAVLSGDTLLSGTAVTFDEALGGGGFGLQVLGNAAFKKTVGSLSGLSVSGNGVFDGAVGGAGALAVGSVTVDGATQINGGAVTTTGAQAYKGGVTLGGNTLLTGSLVNFGSTVAGGGNSLDVAGNAEFNGALSDLSTLGVTGTTLINISSGAVTTSGGQTYGGKVTLAQDTVLTSTAGGQVGLNGGATGDKALTINTSGVTEIGNGITVGSITTDAGGTVKLSGDIQTTGTQSYGEAAQLIGNTTLTGTTVSFANTLAGGSNSLAVTGNAVLNGAATGLSTLSVSGTTALNGGTVTSSGTQTYSGAVTLGNNTTLTGSTVRFDDAIVGGSKSLSVAGAAEFNGAINGLSALGVTGTTLLNTGAVTTSGGQTYGGKVTLNQDTVLISTGSGTVALNGGALSSNALTIQTSGITQLAGGITAGSITTDAGGTVRLSGDIQTTGAQTYGEQAELIGNTALTGTTVSFGGTVAVGAKSLLVTGNAEFNGAVTGPSTLSVTGTTLLNTGVVSTSGAQTYGGLVTLAQDAVLTSTGSGDVTMNAGATGDKALAINTSGVTQLGGGINVGSIATDAGGTVKLSGNIQTTGTQSYGEAAQLLGNTTLTGTTVSFANTLAGGSNSLAVTGNAVLNGAATGLSTLSVSGTTALNGGTVTTSGTQTYSGAVTLGSNTTLTGSTVVFGNTIAGGSKSLGVTGNAEFNGTISGLSTLGVTGTTLLNTGAVTTSGGQTYGGKVTLGEDTVLASTAGGQIALNGGATGDKALAVNTAGVTQLAGGISVGSIATDAGGTVKLSGNIQTTGTQSYGEAAQLIGNTTLTGTTVSFANTLAGGSNSLAVSGNAVLNGAATGLSTLSVSGRTALNGGTVTTSGTQTYTGAVTLGNNTTLTGSTVVFGNTIAGGSKSLGVTGNAEFNGALSGLSTLGVTGTTLLNTSAVTTSGAQTYGGKVTLAQDAVLASTGSGDVTMNAGATGNKALAINTAGVTQLGGGINVGSITTDAGGTVKLSGNIQTTGTQSYGEVAQLVGNTTLSGTTVSFGNTLTGGSNSLAVTGNAELNGAATGLSTLSVSGTTALNGGTVTTSGAQTYTGAVTLGSNATLTGSKVSFGNTVAGGSNSLGVTGNVEFNGAVSGLSTLGVTGTTLLNTTAVTTSGAQTYGGKVTLAQDAVLTSTGSGDVTMNAGATGNKALAINTAGVTQLGGGISVGSITTDAGGTVKLSGNIQTTGTQSYGEAAQLVGNTTLSGTTVSFANTIAGGSNSLAVSGNAELNGAATGLSTLSVSGTTALNGGTVTTSGTQTYTGAVTLGSNATLTGSKVSFGNTVAGGSNSLGVTGNAEFNGTVSGLTTLGVTGTTLLNTTAVTTSGAQTYGGKVTLAQDAVLTSTGSGDVTMNAGATGNKALAINTGGVTQLGGGISVGSITTDAAER